MMFTARELMEMDLPYRYVAVHVPVYDWWLLLDLDENDVLGQFDTRQDAEKEAAWLHEDDEATRSPG